MVHEFHRQPAKGLYLAYILVTTVAFRLPFWFMTNIPRSMRPVKSWDMKRVLWAKIMRLTSEIGSRTGSFITSPNHLAIVPGSDGVWIEPVAKLITGELKIWAAVSSVSSVRIPGYWMHKEGTSIPIAASPMPGEKVIYALHGGAYIRMSASPQDLPAGILRGFLKHVDSVHRVFAVEYRLSSHKPFEVAHPFPAALLDALAGYNYLVNVVGFSSADVIIEGDSAGGNLALALVRYLTEYENSPEVSLPSPPGALILLSPWADMGLSNNLPGSSAFTCSNSDFVDVATEGGMHTYVTEAFVGPHGLAVVDMNAYISPASLRLFHKPSFSNFPRTFIVAGGAEIILDQIRTLRDRMVSDLGEGDGVSMKQGKVKYHEAQDGIHDYLVFSWHEPERTETLKAIAQWIAAL